MRVSLLKHQRDSYYFIKPCERFKKIIRKAFHLCCVVETDQAICMMPYLGMRVQFTIKEWKIEEWSGANIRFTTSRQQKRFKVERMIPIPILPHDAQNLMDCTFHDRIIMVICLIVIRVLVHVLNDELIWINSTVNISGTVAKLDGSIKTIAQ